MQVVATAGHVDHGKSALLHRLTGMEPDRWEEERHRGLTIDLGYVWTDLPPPGVADSEVEGDDPGTSSPPRAGEADGEQVTVAFVDVPGHDHFLPNMLCGVGAVEQVLFVVAADDGWSAQSEEHLQIVDLLRLRGAAVVVTKADLVDDERVAEVVGQVRQRVVGTSIGDAPVVAADSVTGRGIADVRATLWDRLRGRRAAGSPDHSPWLWVDRAFVIKGAGPVVTGMLTSGRFAVGDEVAVLPAGDRARVRGLQRLGEPADEVVAGARVAVNLSGVGRGDLDRGMAVVGVRDGEADGVASRELDVSLRALPHAPIGRKGDWHVHLGTAASQVRVLPLIGDVGPGETGFARLRIASAVSVRAGDRFVLREAGRRMIAGGGVVLDPDPRERPKGADRRLNHALVLERLADPDDAHDRLAALVEAHGGFRRRRTVEALLGRRRVAVPDAANAVASAEDDAAGVGLGDRPANGAGLDDGPISSAPRVVDLGGLLVLGDQVAAWLATVGRVVAGRDPSHAVAVSEIHLALGRDGCPGEVVDAVVDLAVTRRVVARHGGRVVAAASESDYLAARGERQQRFLAILAGSALDPPDPTVAAEEADIPSFEVQDLLDQGVVVSCGPLLFAAEAVADAVRSLRTGPGAGGAAFTAAQARDAWGSARRSAVPLLEHLRAVGVTTFDGDRHRLR